MGPDSSLLDGYAYTEAWRSCHVSACFQPHRREVFPRVVARLGQEYRLTQTCYRNLALSCTGLYTTYIWHQGANTQPMVSSMQQPWSPRRIKEAWKIPGRTGIMALRIYTRKCKALRGENCMKHRKHMNHRKDVSLDLGCLPCTSIWTTLYYIILHSETACMAAQRQSSAGIWEVPWLHVILNARIGSPVQSVGRDQAHHHSRIVD